MKKTIKKKLNVNADSVVKLLKYFGHNLGTYCSIAHQGVWIEPGENLPVKITWRASGEVWEKGYEFLKNKEYFHKKFVVLVDDDYSSNFNDKFNAVKKAIESAQ